MGAFLLGWEKSLAQSMRGRCLLISGSQVRALVRPPLQPKTQILTRIAPGAIYGTSLRVTLGSRTDTKRMSKSEQALLNEVPFRGTGTPMPPTDPLIYRFYELIMVNGPVLKALIEEEFGDGIMSAIDFDMEITRKADPKSDGVSLGMTGKFLPYKYYGATGNALAYGLKEE
jgi:hypothetical protein